jgi:mannan endo-1,4-beta-mannosidase
MKKINLYIIVTILISNGGFAQCAKIENAFICKADKAAQNFIPVDNNYLANAFIESKNETTDKVKQVTDYLQVNGKYLYDITGSKIVLRGTNVDVYKNGWMPSFQLQQIAEAGANAVRINWWAKGTVSNGPYPYNLSNLEEAIKECQRLSLVPIIELHDVTGYKKISTPAFENIIMNFWLDSSVISLIDRYKNTIIINVANEVGRVQMIGTLKRYKQKYINVIKRLRNAGIKVPIMIDAPNCGTGSHTLLKVANQLLAADSLKNIIFSVHTYWQNLSTTKTIKKINEIQASPYCFILGEVANVQGDNPMCSKNYNLDTNGQMDAILVTAHQANMGYLWWRLWNDGVKERQLSNDGYINNLTPQGQKVIHQAIYALSNNKTAYKAKNNQNLIVINN